MWPGISNIINLDVQSDETVAIEDSNGKLIAVGAYMMNEVPEDGQGKAIFTLNYLNDSLWKLGDGELKQKVGVKKTKSKKKHRKPKPPKEEKKAESSESEDDNDMLKRMQQSKSSMFGGQK